MLSKRTLGRRSWAVGAGICLHFVLLSGCGDGGSGNPAEGEPGGGDSGLDGTSPEAGGDVLPDSADVPGSDAVFLSGIVVDSSDKPVAGASVRLSSWSSQTGADGRFAFWAALDADRALEVRAGGFLPGERLVVTAPGNKRVEVTPVRLVPVLMEATLDGSTGATWEDAGAGLRVSVPAGAFSGSVRLTAGLVPVGDALLDDDRFPAPLPRPEGAQTAPLFGIVVDAEGMQPQAPISVAIVQHASLPEGTSVPVGRFDPSSGEWVDAGAGVVTAAGSVSFVIQHLSTYAGALPALPAVATDAPELDVFDRMPPTFLPGEPRVDARSGAMQVGVPIPSLVRRGEAIGLTLFHDTRTLGVGLDFAVALPDMGAHEQFNVKVDSAAGHVRIAARTGTSGSTDGEPLTIATRARTVADWASSAAEATAVEVGRSVPGVLHQDGSGSFAHPTAGGLIVKDGGSTPVATPSNISVASYRTFSMGVDDRRGSPFGPGWHLRGLTHLVQPQCNPDNPTLAGEFDLPALPFSAATDLFVTSLNDRFPITAITPESLATQEILVAATDTDVYAALSPAGSLWRIGKTGDAVLIAGGPQAANTSGEGNASDLALGHIVGLAPGPGGSGVLVATSSFVTHVHPNGTATRIIGTAPSSVDGGGAAPAEGMKASDAALAGEINSFVGGRAKDFYVLTTWSHGWWTVKNGVLHELRTRTTHPHGIIAAIDSQGTLYYTAIGNPCVFRWVDGLTDPELFPTCLNPSAGAAKDGDAATAVVGGLTAMAADGAGGLWMIDGVARAVRYRAANGVVTTVSSPGDAGAWSGVGGPLADAKLATLVHIAATESGNLALSTTGNLLQAASPADMIPRGFDEGTALRKQDDGTWVRVLRDGTRETYDARGLLVSRGKAGATPVEYVYDAWSTLVDDEVCGLPSPLPKLRRIELAGEPLFQFNWNGDHVTGISDAAGRKTTLTWSGSIMTAISLPGADLSVSFKYDADNRIVEKSSRGPAGSILKWAYTYENGYIASVAVPGQGEQVFHAMIPAVAVPENSFSPSHVTMQPVSVSANKPVAQVPSRTGQSGKLTFSPGRVVVQRAAGDVGSVEVDALGRTSRVTEADGTTLSFAHDDAGRIVELRNENTQDVWTYAYDSATDRLAQRIDPAHGMFRYVYDVDGRLIRRRDPAGGTFAITPNVQTGVSWGLPVSVLDPLGRETLFEYDARGNLAKLTAPGAVVTLVQSDVTGRAVRATEPAGIVHSLMWDSYSGETKHFVGDAAAGFVTTYQRTLAIGWTDVGSHVPASAIERATDGMGRTWTWARNEGFQVVRAVTPGDGDVRQTFDHLGRKVTRSTSDGSTEHHELDAAGRLSRRWFSGPAASASVELTYDELGRIAKLVDPKQTETRTFEPGWGWSTMTVQPASGMPGAAQFAVKRTRSSAGVYRQTIEPTMFWIHTDFDGIVTLVERETINQAGSRHDLWKLTPDAARKPSHIDRANGVSSVYHYDSAGRVDKQTEYGGSAELSLSWTFDPAGRPLTFAFDGGTRTYTYDAQGRLAGCSDTGESYGHDKAGARATAKGQAYTRDARGRLVSDGFHDYGYDDLGRRTSRTSKADPSDRTEFAWGAGGLLSQVRRGPAGSASIVASFDYDGSGRRIRKTTAHGTWLYGYLPDSDRLARMVDPAGGEWHFVYAAASAAWSAAVSTTGTVRFTHVDPYGRVVALSDETGKMEALQEGCYGQRLAPVSMTGPEIGFHGMVYDTETGLYVAGGRYYDPETGEFLSPDPNGIEGGTDPWGYAGGNPVLHRDPNGRLFFVAVAAFIAGYEIYSGIKQFAQSDDVRRARAAYQQMTNIDSDDDLAKAEKAHAALARASDKGGDVAIKSVKKAVETVTSPPDAEGVGDLIKDQIKDKAKDCAKDKAGEAIDHLLNGPAAE